MAVTRINKKQMSELDKEYEASLKSIETENKIDRIFYRPIGFRIARMLRGTGITPNMITVISIFVGATVGFMFYHDNLTYNICGILLLVFANPRLRGWAAGTSYRNQVRYRAYLGRIRRGYLVRFDLYRIRSSFVS